MCLLATDDEGFTYNRQINRLTPIQEHKMILEAIRKGTTAERIAEVLSVNVGRIRERQHLLRGIAPEVAEMLKTRMVSQAVFRVLRKMKPMRQIELVEMMISANCFTGRYAEMVLAATRPEQLVEAKKVSEGVTAEDIARMEREMEKLYHDYRLVEDTLGETMLVLVVAKGYVSRMLRNQTIAAYPSASSLTRCGSWPELWRRSPQMLAVWSVNKPTCCAEREVIIRFWDISSVPCWRGHGLWLKSRLRSTQK